MAGSSPLSRCAYTHRIRSYNTYLPFHGGEGAGQMSVYVHPSTSGKHVT